MLRRPAAPSHRPSLGTVEQTVILPGGDLVAATHNQHFLSVCLSDDKAERSLVTHRENNFNHNLMHVPVSCIINLRL